MPRFDNRSSQRCSWYAEFRNARLSLAALHKSGALRSSNIRSNIRGYVHHCDFRLSGCSGSMTWILCRRCNAVGVVPPLHDGQTMTDGRFDTCTQSRGITSRAGCVPRSGQSPESSMLMCHQSKRTLNWGLNRVVMHALACSKFAPKWTCAHRALECWPPVPESQSASQL